MVFSLSLRATDLLISDGYDTKREKIHHNLQVVVFHETSSNQECLAWTFLHVLTGPICLLLIYCLICLFLCSSLLSQSTLHLSIQSVVDWKFWPGKAWGSAEEPEAGANCPINITQLVSQRNQSHFLHLQFQSFQMALLPSWGYERGVILTSFPLIRLTKNLHRHWTGPRSPPQILS